jgi:signal transduction histidine kinase
MLKRLLFLSAAMAIQVTSFAQATRLDSLKSNIYKANTQQLKLQALFAFCDEWESITPDTLYKYTQTARKIADNTKGRDALLQCDYYLAAYLFKKNKLDTAFSTINNVIDRLLKISKYDKRYPVYYALRGNLLLRELRFKDVLKQNLGLLPLFEKNNDTLALVRFNTGIGGSYMMMNNYDEALKWLYKAESLMYTDELKGKCSFVYQNIAISYDRFAHTKPIQKYDDSVNTNLQKAIRYSRKSGNSTNLANALFMYGGTLAEKKKFKPAETVFIEGIAVRKKTGDIFSIVNDMHGLTVLYIKSGNKAKAIATELQALDLINKTGGYNLAKNLIYNYLSMAYVNANDYKKLSEVRGKWLVFKDSIYKENSAEAIADLQTKYDVQKKENTIIKQKYDLNRKQYFIYGITILLVLLAVIGLMVLKYRHQKQKQRINQILIENEREMQKAVTDAKEDERKRIIADLHDDVGGGLSTIRMVSDLIAEQNAQVEQLNQYALKISGITKDVTQRMNTIVWALNAENDTLQSLSEYIRLYGFSFFENSPIEFKSNLPDDAANIELSGLQRKNIFLCVKEALNNVYKHSGAKNAWIDISMADSVITVTVRDNGVGLSNDNPFGNGLKNISKRMAEINGEANFEKGSGTTVVLRVNVA